MFPTEPRSTSSLRPFWIATLVGFAAAAALVLAYTAGRESVPEAPRQPATPQVEIQVTAPAPPPPVEPPAADGPGTERVIYIEQTSSTGTLRIATQRDEAPAKVYLDGEHLGSTPLAKVEVEAGPHTVRFEWPDGATTEQQVEVTADHTQVVRGASR